MSKRTKRWQSLPQTPAGWFGFAVAITAILALIGWLCWRAMLEVPADTARVWAIVATLLVPVVAYVAWRLGLIEARSRLDGIDQAVNKVMDVARRTADVRVGTARRMREATSARSQQSAPPAPELPALPQPTVTHRGPDQGDRRVIDL
jgi:hypothetical protein